MPPRIRVYTQECETPAHGCRRIASHARLNTWTCQVSKHRSRLLLLLDAKQGNAGMAELADAADSKSAEGNLVGVRPPLPAPLCRLNKSARPQMRFLYQTVVENRSGLQRIYRTFARFLA